MPSRSFRYRQLVVPALLLLGAGMIACARSRPTGNAKVPEPSKPVDLGRYLGYWYEIGRYDVSFERDCEGVTAEYSERPDGLIRVLNTCRQGSPNGRPRSAEGKAKIVAGSGNAKLAVSFFGPFFFGKYWILDHADDYTWSIVGEPTGKYLWLLSRDPTPPEDVKAGLIERARALGYNTDMIRMTSQPPG